MKSLNDNSGRIHSFDSLRAIMMLLGLVIHSATTYCVTDLGNSWSIKDPSSTHFSNDIIIGFIHMFRMPIFFLVAGFFGALLFYEKKTKAMIKNRISRIVLPFIVFVLILWPAVALSFSYTHYIFSGNKEQFQEIITQFSSPMGIIPPVTFHLWFLYYLILTTFVAVILAQGIKKAPFISSTLSVLFNKVMANHILRLIVFTGLTFVLYLIINTTEIDTSTSFIPDIKTFSFYFFFYLVGWILFKSKHLLESFKRLDWLTISLGIVLFFVYIATLQTSSKYLIMLHKSIMVWLFIFGIIGVFVRYGKNYSAKMRYISDASYWVYLVHLPLTAILPGLIVNLNIPTPFKFLTVMILSGVICFVTYHYLVRGSFIGQFLNGRKYKRVKAIKSIEKQKEQLANLNR